MVRWRVLAVEHARLAVGGGISIGAMLQDRPDELARSSNQPRWNAGDGCSSRNISSDHRVCSDRCRVSNRDTAQHDGALTEKHVVADGDRTGTVRRGTILAPVVRRSDIHPVSQHAGGPNRDGIHRMKVNALSYVAPRADGDGSSAGLARQPSAFINRTVGPEMYPIDTLKSLGPHEDCSRAETAERTCVDGGAQDACLMPPERTRGFGQPLSESHARHTKGLEAGRLVQVPQTFGSHCVPGVFEYSSPTIEGVLRKRALACCTSDSCSPRLIVLQSLGCFGELFDGAPDEHFGANIVEGADVSPVDELYAPNA